MTVAHPSALVCRDVVELITELLSGALPPQDRARLEQHLLVCPPCTIHLGQVRATIDLTREIREPSSDSAPLPSALRDALRRAAAKGET